MPGRTPIGRTARIEHDEALKRVMTAVLNDDMQLFKQFTDNEGFRRWLTDNVFGLTYAQPQAETKDPLGRHQKEFSHQNHHGGEE